MDPDAHASTPQPLRRASTFMSTLTPITLLTGFLGSGKTTLLKSMLSHPGLADTAVLINEFGEIGLDHTLVSAVSGNVTLLAGGCLCCSVQGELVEELNELYLRTVRGDIPRFARVVIETTGLADPAPVLQSLVHDRIVASLYRLDGVIVTVDAVFGEGQLDQHAESVKQAAVADRLLITKTDLANVATVQSLSARLARINPAATIHPMANGNIDPAILFDCGMLDATGKLANAARWLKADKYRPVESAALLGSRPPGASSERRHDDAIQSFSVSYDQPLDRVAVSSALDMLANFRGENLLRIKGILNLTDEDKPVVIHGVQHVLYPVVTLPQWPDEDRRSRLVFIVRDLDPEFVRRTLDSFLLARRPPV